MLLERPPEPRLPPGPAGPEMVEHMPRQPERHLLLGRLAHRRAAAFGERPGRLADNLPADRNLRAVPDLVRPFDRLVLT